MGTTNIGVVLAGIAPQQQNEITALLTEALQPRLNGKISIIAAPCADAAPREFVQALIKSLEQSGLIPVIDTDAVYSDEEEEKIRKRLEDLGYL